MKRMAMLAMLFACGGGGGGGADASAFVGLWNGTTTVTVNGQGGSSSGYTHITSLGGGDVVIGDVCGNGTGPTAHADSASSMTVHSIACPPGVLGSCSSVVLTVTGGNGSISSGTLSLSGNGTVVGCGSSYPYSLTFVGRK